MRKYTMVDKVADEETEAEPREKGGAVGKRSAQPAFDPRQTPVLSGSAALRPCGPPAGPPMAARPAGRWSGGCSSVRFEGR